MRNTSTITIRIGSSALRAVAVTLAIAGNLLPTFGGVSLAAIGLSVSVVFVFIELAKFWPRFHPIVFNVLLLIGLLAIPLLWTAPPNTYGVEKLTNLLTSTFLSALIAISVRNKRDIWSLAIFWPFAMLPVALVSLVGFEGGRATGFDTNPIWVARGLAAGLIFLTWRIWNTRTIPRLLVDIILSVVLLAALFATGSRGPILGLAVGIAILSLFTTEARFVKISAIVFVGFAFIIYTIFSGVFSSSRLIESVREGAITDSSGRETLYSVALKSIREHPEGVGIGNLSNYLPPHLPFPHSIFLEVFAEQGVVVGTIFTLVIFSTAVRILRRASGNRSALLLAALLGAEITNVSFGGNINARSFFFFLTLSMWLLHQLAHESKLQCERSATECFSPMSVAGDWLVELRLHDSSGTKHSDDPR